jgi:acetyl esterase/lipase
MVHMIVDNLVNIEIGSIQRRLVADPGTCRRRHRRGSMDSTASPRRSRARRIVAALAATLVTTSTLATTAQPVGAHHPRPVQVITDIAYTDPVPPTTVGNLLDLYIPDTRGRRALPLLIWTSGSAWFSDNGKAGAEAIAAEFNPRGYAVAGVSVRSSSQVKFPGQLFDIRAAIRWLRTHARDYGIDPDRFAIMGNSSGGWVSAIAATTSDIRQLDGEPRTGHVSSAVQAAVPFFPPTDFLQMDAQTLEQKETYDLPFLPVIVHDAPTSPESNLIGCPIQTCPEATEAANPITYVRGREVPIHVFHGTFDPLLPPGQSEVLYEALRDAGNEARFTLVDGAGHSVDDIIDAESYTVRDAGRGGRERVGRRPPPTWDSIERFLDAALRRGRH